MEISIEVVIDAQVKDVWKAWVTPKDITQWNFATDEWCCPKAWVELTVGGNFNYRMEAKDGSMSFDFQGEYTLIEPFKKIHYKLEDNREVKVDFVALKNSTKVIETFGAEDEHSLEQQRQGWLGILENFKKHVEFMRL